VRPKLLNRVITAAALLALAAALGVWLGRPPVTAAPPAQTDAARVEVPAAVAPEPTLAPLPLAVPTKTATTGPVKVEITPAAAPAEADLQRTCQPRRRGLFRRR